MSTSTAGAPFPRTILFVVGGMLAMVIGVAELGRLQTVKTEIPVSEPVSTLDLNFSDRPDGAVIITNARDGKLVSVVTGQAGFLRASLRGLAQERLREGLGAEMPFRLTRWKDDRLTLDDLATHRHIELIAFGSSNEGVFAQVLAEGTRP